MSPARLHRERLLASASMPAPTQSIVTGEGGGQPAMPAITPALEHRLSMAIAATAGQGEADVQLAIGVDPAVAQIMLRLTHDLRRLKEIQSIELKVAAKREMLPAYRDWCDLRLSLGDQAGCGPLPASGADDVLPTIMIWSIDTGDYPRALQLAEHVLRFGVPLPSRYQRAAAPLIAEEFATAALKAQARGEAFSLDLLHEVEALTADADMHDEIRAKLMKAIGTELHRNVHADQAGTPEHLAAVRAALVPLERAQDLHDRIGTKDAIKRLRKALAADAKAQAARADEQEQAGDPPVA